MHISVCLIYIHHGSGNVSLSLTFLPFRILDRVSVILFSTKQENPSSHISQFQIHPITKSTRFLVLHLRMNSPVLLSPEYWQEKITYVYTVKLPQTWYISELCNTLSK